MKNCSNFDNASYELVILPALTALKREFGGKIYDKNWMGRRRNESELELV